MKHDDTRIYRRLLEFVRLSKQVLDELPTGYGFLAAQLRRAASSIVQNFSEGYGKGTLREQRRFFRIQSPVKYKVWSGKISTTTSISTLL